MLIILSILIYNVGILSGISHEAAIEVCNESNEGFEKMSQNANNSKWYGWLDMSVLEC